MKLRMLGAIAAALLAGQSHQIAAADSSSVSPKDAIDYVGRGATVCGVVASAKYAEQTHRQPTFLNLDKPYPNQVFTAVIWGSDRSAFSYAPESLVGRKICVSGSVELYKGKAEIIVSGPGQIQVRK
jgi:DNA/RNA endonuclease YhcR with UshA esterase domain